MEAFVDFDRSEPSSAASAGHTTGNKKANGERNAATSSALVQVSINKCLVERSH
jgi:hypothetical protein